MLSSIQHGGHIRQLIATKSQPSLLNGPPGFTLSAHAQSAALLAYQFGGHVGVPPSGDEPTLLCPTPIGPPCWLGPGRAGLPFTPSATLTTPGNDAPRPAPPSEPPVATGVPDAQPAPQAVPFTPACPACPATASPPLKVPNHGAFGRRLSGGSGFATVHLFAGHTLRQQWVKTMPDTPQSSSRVQAFAPRAHDARGSCARTACFPIYR
jgi:hypothetical protein